MRDQKWSKKLVATFLSAALLSSSFAGCANNKDAGVNQQSSQVGSSYPISSNVQLTVWSGLNANVVATSNNVGETEFAKELEKKTGIKVKYIHPAQGQETEQFNLLLTSGDLPDIMLRDWYNFPGSPEKAINDGYIIPLNDVIEKYAPNLGKVLKENPEVDKMVQTNTKKYYVFPCLKLDPTLTIFYGPTMRKDWLDDLGLQIPTTIDEWYTTLKAFKEKKGAEAPLSYWGTPIKNGAIIGAFGITQNFYVKDKKVYYGPAESAYKDFLTLYRKWYSEGLIDPSITSVDIKAMDTNMLNDRTGATFAFNSSGLGKWISAKKGKDSKFDLIAVPYPTLKKGEIPEFGQKDLPFSVSNNAAITTKCKSVELAARYLDYAYSEEGHKLYNFGIENVSYKMENGVPKYTDLILNNPEQLSISAALGKYARSSYEGPYAVDINYFNQFYPMEQQKNSLKVWANTKAEDHLVPRIMQTAEESNKIAKLVNDINTYTDEMYMKFLLGVKPLDSFDSYIAELKKLGIDEVLALKQAALDRYYSK